MNDKMTVREIANKFDVTPAGVYYWISNGLPFITEKVIRRKPRKVIDPKDVEKFLGLTK